MSLLDFLRSGVPEPDQQLDLFPGIADVPPGGDIFKQPNPDVPAVADSSRTLIDLLAQIEMNTRPQINDEPSYNLALFTLGAAAGDTVIRNTERVRYISLLNAAGIAVYLGNGRSFPVGTVPANGSLFITTPGIMESVTLVWTGADPTKVVTIVFSSEPMHVRSGA